MKRTITYLILLCGISFFSCQEKEKVEEIQKISFVKLESSFNSEDIHVNDIAFDEQNKMFIAANEGIHRFDGSSWEKISGDELELTMNTIGIDSKTLYAGTNKGLFAIDLTHENDIRYQLYNTSNSLLPSDSITVIEFDPSGKIWFGTSNGACYLKNEIWTGDISPLLTGYTITGVAFVDSSTFIATRGNNIINAYYDPGVDAITGASRLWQAHNGDYTLLDINCAIGDRNNDIWFGSDAGLTKTDYLITNHIDYREYHLDGIAITSLLEASNGDIWAGTDEGAFFYDHSQWTQLSAQEYETGDITDLEEDLNGSIWGVINGNIYQFINAK